LFYHKHRLLIIPSISALDRVVSAHKASLSLTLRPIVARGSTSLPHYHRRGVLIQSVLFSYPVRPCIQHTEPRSAGPSGYGARHAYHHADPAPAASHDARGAAGGHGNDEIIILCDDGGSAFLCIGEEGLSKRSHDGEALCGNGPDDFHRRLGG
jgi:hypothetical protein